MAENREYLTQTEECGSVCISEEVVASIVADALNEVEGIGAMSQNVTGQITEQLTGKKALRGVHVSQHGEEIALEIYLLVRYGYPIPDVARRVQESVGAAVSAMTGFSVKAVNVHVSGISFN